MGKRSVILAVFFATVFGFFLAQAQAARGTLPNPYRPPVKTPTLPH